MKNCNIDGFIIKSGSIACYIATEVAQSLTVELSSVRIKNNRLLSLFEKFNASHIFSISIDVGDDVMTADAFIDCISSSGKKKVNLTFTSSGAFHLSKKGVSDE